MSEETDRLKSNLLALGLTAEEITVYLKLVASGELTALALSRQIKVARTKVYRILDSLVAKGLVKIEVRERGKVFSAHDFSHLELILAEREEQVARLKRSLPTIIQQLSEKSLNSDSDADVAYYKGREGLAQVTWNSLRARNVLRIYEMATDMSNFLEPGFAERIREEVVERGISVRQLTNYKRIPPYTNVGEQYVKQWELRYVDPQKLKFRFEILIYNDVVSYYSFRRAEPFCVEIRNPELATMQKQLFDYLWKDSIRMNIISPQGEAILVKNEK